MEPIDLSPKSELFIATDIIQTAKELQSSIATLPPEKQPEFAIDAIKTLGVPREIYGGNRIFVHALGAVVLATESTRLSDDEVMYHETVFEDAYFRANFSGFTFIISKVMQSISLELVETQVLASKSNPEFTGERIRSGMYVPVHSVGTVLAA